MSQSQTLETKISHESAEERQFVRVSIPTKFQIIGEKHDKWFDVEEVSLGGFSFLADKNAAPFEMDYKGEINIKIALGSVSIDLQVHMKIVKILNGRISATFVNLDQNKREVLRYIISAYLSGELVNINGVVNVLQRENFVNVRKNNGETEQRSGFKRLKSVLGTLIFTLGALFVLALVGNKIHRYFFTVEANYASVTADLYTLKMPANGYVDFLVKNTVEEVNKGQPVAVVSTQLMTHFSSPDEVSISSEIEQANVQQLLERTLIETVISSPCDCKLVWANNADPRYGYRDETLMYLIPKDKPVYVEATFDYAMISKLKKGTSATISVVDNQQEYQGELISAKIDEISKTVKTIIKVDGTLPDSALFSAATVTLSQSLPTTL